MKQMGPSSMQKQALIEEARRVLLSEFAPGHARNSEITTNYIPPYEVLNVTLRCDGRLRASKSGRGGDAITQVRAAMRRAVRDTRFGARIVARDLDNLHIEIWIEIFREKVAPSDDGNGIPFLFGIHGLEVVQGGARAYYKPSVALTTASKTVSELLATLCIKAGLPPAQWQMPSVTIYRTYWLHLTSGCAGPYQELIGLRSPKMEAISQKNITEMFRNGSDYLTNVQDANGWYLYEENALRDTYRDGPVNLVRMAGCAYSLSIAANLETKVDSRRRYYESSVRCSNAILGRAVDGPFGLMILDEPENGRKVAKLGIVALLSLAIGQRTVLGQFSPVFDTLIKTLIAAQRSNGSFRCRLDTDTDNDDAGQDYYPGQALLALALAAQLGYRGIREAVLPAFSYYRAHFSRRPNSGFILWQVDAWTRFAMLGYHQDIPKFVFLMIEWILKFQISKERDSRTGGGFRINGRPTIATSVYTEAIVRGAQLAQFEKDFVRRDRYLEAIVDGIAFCRTLMVSSEHRPFVSRSRIGVGGVTGNLETFDVRCDNVQHLITMAIAALELHREISVEQPGGWLS